MFEPSQLSMRASKRQATRAACAGIKDSVVALFPEKLRAEVRVDVQEVACGDSSCAPVHTRVAFWFIEGMTEIKFDCPSTEVTREALEKDIPAKKLLQKWLATAVDIGNEDNALSVDERGNKKIMIAVVEQRGLMLALASEALKGDRDVVATAVRNNGLALRYASENLKATGDIVLTALQQNSSAIDYASPSLKNNREVVLEAARLGQVAWALKDAPQDFKSDFDILMTSVSSDGDALQWASPEILEDHSIVLGAVSQCGSALRFAAPSLKASSTIVLAAVQNDGLAIRFSKSYTSGVLDRTLVLAAVQQNGKALKLVYGALKSDPQVILEALKSTGKALEFVNIYDRGNIQFVVEALANWGGAIHYASSSVRPGSVVSAPNRRKGAVHEYLVAQFRQHQSLMTFLRGSVSLKYNALNEACKAHGVRTRSKARTEATSALANIDLLGEDSARAFRRQVADYIGAPYGHEWSMICRAMRGLQRYLKGLYSDYFHNGVRNLGEPRCPYPMAMYCACEDEGYPESDDEDDCFGEFGCDCC